MGRRSRPSRPGRGKGRNRSRGERPRPLFGGHQQVEEWPDGEWVVRRVTGSSSTKPYRCPGCDQLIPVATPHVVAWPVDPPSFAGAGLDERRHWHNGCWQARDRRHRRGEH